MANITLGGLLPGAVVSGSNPTKAVGTTASPTITPSFSSVVNVSGPAIPPRNYNYSDLLVNAPIQDGKSESGFLRGRRPPRGLLFPRGYYNR